MWGLPCAGPLGIAGSSLPHIETSASKKSVKAKAEEGEIWDAGASWECVSPHIASQVSPLCWRPRSGPINSSISLAAGSHGFCVCVCWDYRPPFLPISVLGLGDGVREIITRQGAPTFFISLFHAPSPTLSSA